jgi:serine/threonine protein kinase
MRMVRNYNITEHELESGATTFKS